MSEAEAVQNPTEPVAPVEEEKAIEQPEVTETKETEETKESNETEATEEKQPEVAETKESNETEAAEKKNGAAILKTTAKIDRENLQNNRKFDASVRKVTDDPEEIRKQVREPVNPQPQSRSC